MGVIGKSCGIIDKLVDIIGRSTLYKYSNMHDFPDIIGFYHHWFARSKKSLTFSKVNDI